MTQRHRWTRGEKLAGLGVLAPIVFGIGAYFVPEIRRVVGVEKPALAAQTPAQQNPGPADSQKPKPDAAPKVDQNAQSKVVGNKNVAGNDVHGKGNVVGNNNKGNSQASAPSGIAITGGTVNNPVVNNYSGSPAEPSSAPPKIVFHDKAPEYFTLLGIMGTLNLHRNMLTQPGGWHGLADIDGYRPLTIYVKDDTLHIDAVVQDSAGKVIYKIENAGTGTDINVTVLPPNWDRNWADNELEIVDDKEVPVFQMIYHRPAVVELHAIFYGVHGSIIAFPPKQRLFRYPSREHLGERAL